MTSSTLEFWVPLERSGAVALHRQIAGHLRDAIRAGRLSAHCPLPSTRDLCSQLGVSRPVVLAAYDELASEGFINLRPGARPAVAKIEKQMPTPISDPVPSRPAHDLRPAVPDLTSFPRRAWLRAYADAIADAKSDDLGYDAPHGLSALREALCRYLARVRGVTAQPAQFVVTAGFSEARRLAAFLLANHGIKAIAVEDPSYSEWSFAEDARLELRPVPVDSNGIDVSRLPASDAGAVMLTPAHQFPTGSVLSGERRGALIAWLQQRDALAIEDDYDSEFRYDRNAVPALQALAPTRVIYAGTASKCLAPGLRLGWLVVPAHLVSDARRAQGRLGYGPSRLDQLALARFIDRGELDSHLRRMRAHYRKRRDEMLAAIGPPANQFKIRGIAAGLHLALELPVGLDERFIRDQALQSGVSIGILSDYSREASVLPPTLLLGYARASSASMRIGGAILANIVKSSLRQTGSFAL